MAAATEAADAPTGPRGPTSSGGEPVLQLTYHYGSKLVKPEGCGLQALTLADANKPGLCVPYPHKEGGDSGVPLDDPDGYPIRVVERACDGVAA